MKKLFSNLTLKLVEWEDPTKNTMVYKYPMEGRKIFFGSKLTVRESQVAVFLNKGEIADVFGPGVYTLKSSNLPIISNLLGLPYGFKAPFTCDVFFINTKQFTNQKWGTTNPITMRDKDFGTIRIRGYGSYAFKVNNAEIFLKELFGTNSTFNTEDITNYLKSILISTISDTISESKIGALDLASNLLEFNKIARDRTKEQFENLGLALTNLVIENISFPEAVEKAIDARSSLGVLGDQMDTYVKYQSAQAIRDAAKNPGVSGLGTQLGAGMAIGEMMKTSINNASKPVTSNTSGAGGTAVKFCSECGAQNKPKAKFCNNCGKAFSSSSAECPKCNSPIVPNSKFCENCGTKIK